MTDSVAIWTVAAGLILAAILLPDLRVYLCISMTLLAAAALQGGSNAGGPTDRGGSHPARRRPVGETDED